MNNPILLSESFENAAYALRQSTTEFYSRSGIDQFAASVDRFVAAVDKFHDSVERFVLDAPHCG